LRKIANISDHAFKKLRTKISEVKSSISKEGKNFLIDKNDENFREIFEIMVLAIKEKDFNTFLFNYKIIGFPISMNRFTVTNQERLYLEKPFAYDETK
jgi:hypothetical protein